MPGDRAKRQWKRRRGKETLKEKTVEKKRRTQLGIGSWTYPYHCGLGGLIRPELAVKQAMPPCELIEKAKKYNLHYVQICENSPLAHCLPQELADIRRKAEENGIKLEVGMRGAARGNLLRMIAIAEKLDAKLLRCVIDDNGYEPDLEEIIITLKSVLPVLEEKDIVLGIIMVINTSVGMITPPMAVNLYIASRVSGSRIENICKKIVPFLIVEIIFVILISNFPQIITWLPELIG